MAKAKVTPKPKAEKSKPEKPPEKTPTQKTVRKTKKPDEQADDIRHCSFCNSPSNRLRVLIAAPNNVFICEECVGICVKILLQASPIEWQNLLIKLMADPKNAKVILPKKDLKQPQTKKARKPNA